MNDVTNRTIFLTMIIIGIISIGLILGLYQRSGSLASVYSGSLGATAYDSGFGLNSNQAYIPNVNTNYYPSTNYTYTDIPSTTTYVPRTTTTTTYTYSYPEETNTYSYPINSSYAGTNYNNLDAYGCYPGANYSVTTGRSCYNNNNYNYNNNYGYNYNGYNYNSGGYWSNGVYIDSYGCGTGIIYSVTTGQYCYNRY